MISPVAPGSAVRGKKERMMGAAEEYRTDRFRRRSQFRQIGERAPAGTLRPDFRHHDAIALVQKFL